MRLNGKLVGDLTAADIQLLIDNRVSESRVIEFKGQLPSDSPESRIKFLASASAFANAGGGVMLFGIKCERVGGRDAGIASEITPIDPNVNLDAEIQRLEGMLRTSLNPPLTHQVAFARITVLDGGAVVALGIRRSLSGPHMMTFSGHHRIYRRSDSGRYEPDVTELRRMFLEDQEWSSEVEAFRRRRIIHLATGAIDIPSMAAAALVHVLPVGRLQAIYDLRDLHGQIRDAFAPLTQHSGHNARYNFDGVLCRHTDHPCQAYTQVFRSGAIEIYTAQYWRDDLGSGPPRFFAPAFQHDLTKYIVAGTASLSRIIQVDPPFAVALTLLRCEGSIIPQDGFGFGRHDARFVGNEIPVPAIVIDDLSDTEAVLRPAFDVVWQTGGYTGAPVPASSANR